ncbi:MAG: hypothetical protein HY516_02120 [Candidatus Aenigmarchaeota archaeon]|nr:hypothetical protein [Candidatus Aenigmarchaeota archaeon]
MTKKLNVYAGAHAASWTLAALVVGAELLAPLKAVLSAVFGHHWIGKAVITTFMFIAFSYAFKGKRLSKKTSDNDVAWNSAVGSLTAIFLFYLAEFLL